MSEPRLDMQTVALVDDDQHILKSASMALHGEGYRTQTYTDGSEALHGLEMTPPDIAIFDVEVPHVDGMELFRRLRQHGELPVIFLTSKDDESEELFYLAMGADDFLRKPISRRLLVERIKMVLRRRGPQMRKPRRSKRDSVIECGPLAMRRERHSCTWRSRPVRLTATEFKILQALALRPGIYKSRNDLMDEVYPDQVYVVDRTIDSYIKRLRTKLRKVDRSFNAIETLYGFGYRIREEPSRLKPEGRASGGAGDASEVVFDRAIETALHAERS